MPPRVPIAAGVLYPITGALLPPMIAAATSMQMIVPCLLRFRRPPLGQKKSIPAVHALLPMSLAMRNRSANPQTIDEDVDKSLHDHLPIRLLACVAHADQGAHEVFGREIRSHLPCVDCRIHQFTN